MTEKKQEYTVSDARALIVEENRRRSTACWAEIEKVLAKHHCELNGEPVLAASPVGYTIQVRIWVRALES